MSVSNDPRRSRLADCGHAFALLQKIPSICFIGDRSLPQLYLSQRLMCSLPFSAPYVAPFDPVKSRILRHDESTLCRSLAGDRPSYGKDIPVACHIRCTDMRFIKSHLLGHDWRD